MRRDYQGLALDHCALNLGVMRAGWLRGADRRARQSVPPAPSLLVLKIENPPSWRLNRTGRV